MNEVKKTRSELKREAIIDAAKAAFKEYGVDATSMDKLAELAQVSKRTVYNHFTSKEALVIHLLTDLWNQAMVQTGLVYEGADSLEAQLGSLLMDEIDLVGGQEYIDLARVAFGHYLFQPEAIQAEMTKFSSEQTALYQWLEQATQAGDLQLDDVEHGFSQLHNLLKGSCFWPQMLQLAPILNKQEKQALVSETIRMFMARYRSSP